MSRVPPTQKTELEKIQAAIEEEAQEWAKLGMNAGGIRHDNESLWILKLQCQAMMNIILKNNLATEEEVNTEFKRIMLGDMRIYREQAEAQRREAIVPRAPLIGPDGKPLKI